MVLDNHVVTIGCPDFVLTLYFGRAVPPNRSFHVHESRFLELMTQTRDPERLKVSMIWDDDVF